MRTRAGVALAALWLGSVLAGCEHGGSLPLPAEPGPTAAEACDDDAAPRQLRLLTRREYNNTVRDLLAGMVEATSAACSQDSECNLLEQSCVAGACQTDPCELVPFVLPAAAGEHTSVHVAGSFNGWAATVADGGWAMTYSDALGAWITKRALSDGDHSYKFVVDESTWIADPDNLLQEPDGFGGFNSKLSLSCAGAAPPSAPAGSDPAADFPVESRPEGYAFDNAAASGLVTSIHVEQYLRAAETLAASATSDLESWLPCASSGDEACARQLVTDFGARAFRRPLEPAEIDKFAALVTSQDDFRSGVDVVLRAMLSSPFFLYRFEVGEPSDSGAVRLRGWEIAGALSYALWGTMPDAELLRAAEQGELDGADGIATQARRMLDDPRAHELLGRFAAMWLGIEEVPRMDKQAEQFPEWNKQLGEAMLRETERFVSHVAFESTGRFDELLLADYGYPDEALATLYGSESGDAVILPSERQAGLLAQASVLASTSHSDQTSPVRRGLFVRRRLLCQELGTPPPNAGGVPDVDPTATTRERFSQHSADPACAMCHQHIDPIGFGFEGFDPIGKLRDSEAGKPIDASGALTDVERLGSNTSAPFETLGELATLLADSRAAEACYARQSYRFVLGAKESEGDRCSLEALEEQFVASEGDMRELLVAITQLPSFVRRK